MTLPRPLLQSDFAPPLRVVSLRHPSDGVELFRLALVDATGLVRGQATGNWSLPQTARYCTELENLVVASRQRFGRVRVLLDRRGIAAQSDDVRVMLAEANRRIFRDDDKIALVVDSSLMKSSLRERMPHVGTRAFLSITAAETWLSV